jgi:hypothetical protein
MGSYLLFTAVASAATLMLIALFVLSLDDEI